MNELGEKLNDLCGGHLPAGLVPWLPSILVFLVAALGFLAVAWLLTRSPKRRVGQDGELEDEDQGGLFAAVAPALAVQIPESEKERRDFGKLLRQAGMYHPRARTTIYALRFILLFVPLVVAGAWIVWANDPAVTWKVGVGGLVAAAALSIVPRLYVWARRRHRQARIRRGLPDTIDMLSMCASGGMGLSESLDHVAGQLAPYPELAQELMILRRQAEVGSLGRALADFSERVDLPEARQLAALLTRGTRLGTQLAGSLNEQADHLRVARRQLATTAANKTPVKLVFPLLFCLAPAALLLLMAPAVFDLHDFLYPEPETAATAAPGEGFGTEAIIRTLRDLNQKAEPFAPDESSSLTSPPGT